MKKTFFLLILFSISLPLGAAKAHPLPSQVLGKILLQVESSGEAWYVEPKEEKRHFLGRPSDAFKIMRELGTGISDKDLRKVPVATGVVSGEDTDNDGLPDQLERALGTDKTRKDTDGDGYDDKEELERGYNPLKESVFPIDEEFARKHKGKIFLQVEQRGEAWYIHPEDNKRYFLGRPADAFALMRELGLGVTDEDLTAVPRGDVGTSGSSSTQVLADDNIEYDLRELEKKIHREVNQRRVNWGLDELDWNGEVAGVARIHSSDLREENKNITSGGDTCDLPLIHHENLKSGLYDSDRLKNQEIYYFSLSGENIALISAVTNTFYTSGPDSNEDTFRECEELRNKINSEFRSELGEAGSRENKKKIIQQELEEREELFQDLETMEIEGQSTKNEDELVEDMVTGWMNSPSHRENILNTDFDQAGIGVSFLNGYIIATQSFIKEAECGYLGGPCCQKNGSLPYCYESWECREGTCESVSS